MGPWVRWARPLALVPLVALLALPRPLPAQSDADSSRLVITVDGARLTIVAQDVSQQQLLEGLAHELGFALRIAGRLQEGRRSFEVQSKPWEEAIKEAIAPAGAAFVYEVDASGARRLVQLFVVPPQEGGAGPTLAPAPASAPTGRTPIGPPPQAAADPVAPEAL